jgi:rRNA maturation protein Nop10
MSGLTASGSPFSEVCTSCGRETEHSVSIELRTESLKRENAAYSREPYRVATCSRCGLTTAIRMNNA